MGPLEIVALVVGILLVNLLIWIPLLLWLKSGVSALKAELEASGEKTLRGPEPAIYRGASDEFSRVKGNGTIALTDRRLVFRKLVGAERIDIPTSRIELVREERWFLGAYQRGHQHAIVRLDGGAEVGFFVTDHPGWMTALGKLTGATGG